jgi:hypothetical protein
MNIVDLDQVICNSRDSQVGADRRVSQGVKGEI